MGGAAAAVVVGWLLQGFKSRAGDLKGRFTGQISCHPITDCSLPRDQREREGRRCGRWEMWRVCYSQTSAAPPLLSCSLIWRKRWCICAPTHKCIYSQVKPFSRVKNDLLKPRNIFFVPERPNLAIPTLEVPNMLQEICRRKWAGWGLALLVRSGCSLLLPHLRHQSSLAASLQSKDHLQRV